MKTRRILRDPFGSGTSADRVVDGSDLKFNNASSRMIPIFGRALARLASGYDMKWNNIGQLRYIWTHYCYYWVDWSAIAEAEGLADDPPVTEDELELARAYVFICIPLRVDAYRYAVTNSYLDLIAG
jgi:hypothetical protein